jgi:hypothetical protein
MDEQQPVDVPRDEGPPADEPYKPPVAEPLEGPDPNSVAPGGSNGG